jgi:hypothetical protein
MLRQPICFHQGFGMRVIIRRHIPERVAPHHATGKRAIAAYADSPALERARRADAVRLELTSLQIITTPARQIWHRNMTLRFLHAQRVADRNEFGTADHNRSGTDVAGPSEWVNRGIFGLFQSSSRAFYFRCAWNQQQIASYQVEQHAKCSERN